ncbi:speckle-type POZ protein B [Caerostris extrusa]|uniref:Speckle-type POZ protein B n=1 Tax=Caerostris extrusa TaxID=172846 RepID=A0AAV4NF28_CAEEX|nr:speckle-type POZ protein B [Caerostris extrusa]
MSLHVFVVKSYYTTQQNEAPLRYGRGNGFTNFASQKRLITQLTRMRLLFGENSKTRYYTTHPNEAALRCGRGNEIKNFASQKTPYCTTDINEASLACVHAKGFTIFAFQKTPYCTTYTNEASLRCGRGNGFTYFASQKTPYYTTHPNEAARRCGRGLQILLLRKRLITQLTRMRLLFGVDVVMGLHISFLRKRLIAQLTRIRLLFGVDAKRPESIYNPTFVVDALEGTKWKLGLYSRGYNNGHYIGYIFNREKNCNNLKLELDFEMSFLAVDGSALKTVKEHKISLSKGESLCKSLFLGKEEVFIRKRSVFLSNDTLMARCRMCRSDGKMTENEECFARTCIGVEASSIT